ncbi:ATP-binding protein [Bacteroides thetaiotaomicron]
MRLYRILLASGYLSIFLMALLVAYTCHNEQRTLKLQEEGNQRINELRQDINRLNMQIAGLSFQGETVAEWDEDDMAQYHMQRLVIDSTLHAFSDIFQSKRTEIDTLRMMLADKEARLNELAGIHLRQRTLNRRIADIVPVIARQSSEEKPSKPKRKGFLGIFGKKEEAKPTVTTTMLHSLNSNVINEQKAQSRRLSEQADSLAARNAELNLQLQTLINRIDCDVQKGLQTQEAQTASMRKRSFVQIGSLTGFVLILLLCLFIIIHRDTKHIRRYRRKTAELIRQLKKSVQQNEALIASRKKAVHTITHELRTPLTAITGYAGLMQKERDEVKRGQYIQNIQQSSDRMRDMLNTLLDFFRLDNGKEQPRLSPCRISAIVHTLETEFMPVAMNKGLSLIVKNRNDAVVLTDKERIVQIGNNLLSNAIKFTEEGGVSLIADYTDGVLIITVEDTGTGMTEEEQHHVFNAFERLSNAAAKDGFGLGLAIVNNIVTMLGGTIHLDSAKGKGSRFMVEIPMQKADDVPEQVIQTYIHRKDRNINVVAIDNDEVLLLMLKEMYAQEGIHCDTCTDAAELMEMVRRKEYNLLLTDLNMLGINGFELLELLRSSNVGNSQTIPVVVATASGSCDAEELLAKGFAGCLFKPFSISELMEVSDRCAIKETPDGKPDFSALLSYGNEAVMLEKLIEETEKEMQAVRDAAKEKDLKKLDSLTHHLRSSWEVLRADHPLRELYGLLHGDALPDGEALSHAVTAVLDKGAEIIRLAEKERRKYEDG